MSNTTDDAIGIHTFNNTMNDLARNSFFNRQDLTGHHIVTWTSLEPFS